MGNPVARHVDRQYRRDRCVRQGHDVRSWLQNILLGIAVSSLLVYTRLGFRGNISALAKPVVHFLETPFLCKIGRFSYSTYLIHYPILRLAVALTALWTSSILVLGGIAFFVYAPLTVLIAYGFHVRFERPFQKKRFLVRELET
jgi:peptidoglycan/LPS O-acetylase OafA/YrhL